MLRKLLALFICTIALVIGGFIYIAYWAHQPVSIPQQDTGLQGVVTELSSGMPLSTFVDQLKTQELIDSSTLFFAYVRLFHSYERFQAGKYLFQDTVTPRSIVEAILSGATYHEIKVQLTIPEGFPLKLTLKRLAANGIGSLQELEKLANDQDFLKSLGVPSTSLEGYTYPATYTFAKVPTAKEALTTLIKQFWKNLPRNYEADVNAKGLTLNQAVTFASLIELETLHDDERAMISEVIWQRLNDRAPLGIDAAIIYGIDNYKGDLKWKHLKDEKNIYNTRIHRGLPPTPIGATTSASLKAVLTPTKHGYYYYVLIPETRRHHFSKTLAEHNQYVKKLVEATKR